MKKILQFTTALLGVSMVFISYALSATINATSCSQSNVQTAISTAVGGDVVLIPAGSCTWATPVSWSNKNISVIGAGVGNTIITGATLFSIQITTNPASFRVSGMTLTGTTPNKVISINSSNVKAAIKGWRVDHVRFNYSSGGLAFYITGVNWGLIDHCTFDGSGYEISAIFAYLNSEGSGTGYLSGDYDWSLPLHLGSDEAVYFENCDINFSSGTTQVFDLVYGGRAVLRYSTIDYSYFITHSARTGDRGGLLYEVYNNTFTGKGFFRPAQLRSGTGIIFNNTITGYGTNTFDLDNQRSSTENGCYVVNAPLNRCNGSSSYDGNIDSNGWPCLDQIGRAPGTIGNQPSEPLYTWNNGSNATCATGGACNNSVVADINGGCPSSAGWIKTIGNASPHSGGVLDYVNNGSMPKPGYKPYTYPHPLNAIAPPRNLRILK
jgi:hypothetical protein